MKWPLKKIHVTQKWGVNGHIYKRFGFKGHNGIDLRMFNEDGERASTAKLYAPHDGEVVEKWTDGDGYGKYFKIENNEEGSILAHLKERFVNRGDKVKEGQLIGTCDNTGWSTGAHLHWGYYRKPRDRNNGYGGTIDPTPFINQNKTMSDIRITLLNERGVKTEGDLRAMIASHEDIDNVKKDLQNTKEKLERLKGEYLDIKDDYKRDVGAYETRLKEEKKRFDDAIATIAKEIGATQDLPAIMEEVARLVSDADQKEEKRQEAIEHQEKVLSLKKKVESLREALERLRQENIDLKTSLQQAERETLPIKQSNMLDKLNGKKSYIVSGLAGVVIVLKLLGVVSAELASQILTILGVSGMVTLRHAIKKAE